MKLKLNQKAPIFKLPSTSGNILKIDKIKKYIILYFYPKDDIPMYIKVTIEILINLIVF